MAYGIKYIVEFADRLKNTYEVHLKQKDYTGASENLYATDNPLVYTMVEKQKYDPIKGMGGTIELIAREDRQLIDLYTVGHRGWVVEAFKNSEIDFTGYIEPELYEQTLKQDIAYPVTITINNGIAVLKREKYVQENGNKYRGIANIFEVLQNCFHKILPDLPEITKLRISKTLRVNGDWGDAATNSDNDNAHSVLESLIVNDDNFIDEDNESMYCYEVLESVLSPLGYSLYIHKHIIYILHHDSIRTGGANFYEYDILSSVIQPDATEVYIDGFRKDITNLKLSDYGFNIQSGFNNYILVKNRYVKRILEKIDFNNDENYTGDPNDFVWDFGDLGALLSVGFGNIRSHSEWLDYLAGNSWITNSVGGSEETFLDYIINYNTNLHYTIPSGHILEDLLIGRHFNPANNNQIAFAGGMKSKKIVDGQEISYAHDNQSYTNYIFVNNPWYDLRHCLALWGGAGEEGGFELPPYEFHNYYADIRKYAFKYDREIPYVFPSDKVVIRLHFTVKFCSPSLYRFYWSSGDQQWNLVDVKAQGYSGYTEEDLKNNYGRFAIPVQVRLKDSDGNTDKFLDFASTFPQNWQYTNVPYEEDRRYEWKTGTVNETKFVAENINELGDEENILNKDFEVYVDIPADFGIIGKISFQFWNYIYKLEERTDYLALESTFKEDFLHIGFRDIYTEIINISTGEPMDLNDQELQYYLSENYKTEKVSHDLTSTTGDDKYITDISGILKTDTYLNTNIGYINEVYHTTVHDILEDFKATLYIEDYQHDKIHLKCEFQEHDIYPVTMFQWTWDNKWQNQLYAVLNYENNVRHNVIEVTLENFY